LAGRFGYSPFYALVGALAFGLHLLAINKATGWTRVGSG
jgi:hypothetical protein